MQKNNDFLGSQSIGKLLFKMSMPATIAMIVMMLYNIIDSIFVGKFVGMSGFGAISITLPFIMIFMAVGHGIGMGSSSLISRMFGENKKESLNKVFGNTITLTFIFGIVISIFSFLFLDYILVFLGSTDTILIFAKDYLSIILIGIIFQLFALVFNSIIRAEGNAGFSMILMIISALSNIMLDYIFIIIYDFGIKGAAYATVIAQILSFLMTVFYFYKRSVINFEIKYLKLDYPIIKDIFKIGLTSFAREISMVIVAILVNNSLKYYGGDLAISIYGIIYRVIIIIIMPSMGILQGSLPIIGYNYGAKKMKRVQEITLLSIKSSTLIITVFFIIVMLFPNFFSSLFTNDLELIEKTKGAIRIFMLMFPLVGSQIIIGGYFQAIGKAKEAFIVSLIRTFIALIPLVLILPLFFSINGIWYAYVLSDFIGFCVSIFYYRKEKYEINFLKDS